MKDLKVLIGLLSSCRIYSAICDNNKLLFIRAGIVHMKFGPKGKGGPLHFSILNS